MSDNRKYYYLKLKENYFDDDSIGAAGKYAGRCAVLQYPAQAVSEIPETRRAAPADENIPYTAQMIATITRQQIGTVERALQIFLKLGLVEVLDSGTFT